MVKNWKISDYTNQKIKDILGFFPSWKSKKIGSEAEKISVKESLGNSSNDILVSRAGQVKIANLDSCLNLVSSDFIVF